MCYNEWAVTEWIANTELSCSSVLSKRMQWDVNNTVKHSKNYFTGVHFEYW
jgi:hypothetical protein